MAAISFSSEPAIRYDSIPIDAKPVRPGSRAKRPRRDRSGGRNARLLKVSTFTKRTWEKTLSTWMLVTLLHGIGEYHRCRKEIPLSLSTTAGPGMRKKGNRIFPSHRAQRIAVNKTIPFGRSPAAKDGRASFAAKKSITRAGAANNDGAFVVEEDCIPASRPCFDFHVSGLGNAAASAIVQHLLHQLTRDIGKS